MEGLQLSLSIDMLCRLESQGQTLYQGSKFAKREVETSTMWLDLPLLVPEQLLDPLPCFKLALNFEI